MVDKYGKRFGIKVGDIYDARANSIMGMLYIKENIEALKTTGFPATGTSLYMMHFLGSGDGKKFFSNLLSSPDDPAAKVLPKASAANKPIFYKNYSKANPSTASPRSFRDIWDLFTTKVSDKAPVYTAMLNGKNGGIDVASTDTMTKSGRAVRRVALESTPSAPVVAKATPIPERVQPNNASPATSPKVAARNPQTVAQNTDDQQGETARSGGQSMSQTTQPPTVVKDSKGRLAHVG